MQIHLNGNDITNREQLHDALSEALELPEWYGRSLDALYDCLRDAAEENELLQVRLED